MIYYDNSKKEKVAIEQTREKIVIENQEGKLDGVIYSKISSSLANGYVAQFIVKNCAPSENLDPNVGTRDFMGSLMQSISRGAYLKEVDLSGNALGRISDGTSSIEVMNKKLRGKISNFNKINLANNEFSSANIDDLASFISRISTLRSLDLSKNPKISDNFGLMGLFSKIPLKDLIEINFSDCNLDSLAMTFISQQSANMKRINVANNPQVTFKDIKNLFNYAKKLEELDIRGCKILPEDSENILKILETRPGLRILYSGNENIPQPSVTGTHVRIKNSSNEYVQVDIADDHITIENQAGMLDDNISASLAGSLMEKKLNSFVVRNSPPGNDVVRGKRTQTFMANISQFVPYAKSLREIDFSGNDLGMVVEGRSTLAAIRKNLQTNTSVEKLNLADNNLTRDHKDDIAGIIKLMTNLKILDLSNNPNLNNNHAVIAILDEIGSKKDFLEEINLSNCNLDDLPITYICQGFTKLKRIDISYNPNIPLINLNGFITYARMASLQELDITGCNLSAEEQQKFLQYAKEKRPHLTVIVGTPKSNENQNDKMDISVKTSNTPMPADSIDNVSNTMNLVEENLSNQPVNKSSFALIPEELSLNRLNLRSKLGKGNFAMVYKGKWRGEDVAIKVDSGLETEFNNPYPNQVEINERVADFEAEAQVLIKYQHPNIVAIKAYGVYPEKISEEVDNDVNPDDQQNKEHVIKLHVIVMEVLTMRLSDYISQTASDPKWDAFVMIATHIAEALKFLHNHVNGIVHGDLKPENVMLEVKGGKLIAAKAIDPGIAAAIHNKTITRTFKHGLGGTPLYMAPEQHENPDVRCTPPVEMFSYGLTMATIFTKGRPFTAEFTQDLKGNYAKWSGNPKDLPPVQVSEKVANPNSDTVVLQDLLKMCLWKAPEKRATASAVVGYLQSHSPAPQ